MRGSPQSSKVAVCNLIGLIAAGISVSWWILYFTDFFPVVGGLLGLGGLFTWIAFVSNILTDERKAEMQQSFDRFVLQRRGLLILRRFRKDSAVLYFLSGRGEVQPRPI